MRVTVFLNQLGLGGTEKAATRWVRGLCEKGHNLSVLALQDGLRRTEFEAHGAEVFVTPPDAEEIARRLHRLRPDVLHVHAPGHPHEGDVLGEALAHLPRIPLVQTNIFGQSLNPKEDAWTDFRLFISWTSCVQAARRSFLRLNAEFFRRASVTVYPLDPQPTPPASEVAAFRKRVGVQPETILLGRLSRPEPNKWTDLAVEGFRAAAERNPHIKLLLREPPPQVWRQLEQAPDRNNFILLPATNDAAELTVTMAALDVVLHTSVIGESFGYGIAEPMNFGKPVIANSTPWGDQAQIELVRHGEGGFIASTVPAIASRILELATDARLREKMGSMAQTHIQALATPETSVDRLEAVLRATVSGQTNPFLEADLKKALATAEYLDRNQFGHTWAEQFSLRPYHHRVRFHEFRRALRTRIGGAARPRP